MSPALSRRRLALFALFFVPGFSIASWVTRTPAVRDLLGASTAQMGLVLFGLSVGSMVGILSSGPLVARLSTRPVMLAGISLVVLSMPTVGLGAAASSSVLATAGLALFGLGMGSAEVAMNVDGADLETGIARYVAFLVGPPVLGFVGEHASLRAALIVPMALVAVAVVVAPALRGRRVVEPVGSSV